MADTSVISTVAFHMTAETAKPALPASPGSNVSQSTWSAAGYDTIGSKNLSSHDHDLNTGDITMSVDERHADIVAPFSDGLDDSVLVGRRIENIEIPVFSMGEALYTFLSDFSYTSNVGTWTTLTKRTVIIEVHNTGVIYLPKVHLTLQELTMGKDDGQTARAVFRCKLFNTTNEPAGWSIEHY